MKVQYIVALFIISFLISCEKTDLYEYPSNKSNKAEITSISLLDEGGNSVILSSKIDTTNSSITIKVASSVMLNRLVPRAVVSEGVIVEPKMGIYTDLSTPINYTLIAGDRITKRVWVIAVSY